ncbi:glycosyltransferase family A protein [Flavobacterium xanthum]|uniref:Glycosyl transferase family 2 n=1 Tax=Flavobacterium xanthum TaxID=69322 RepID=A0A1M7BGW8_9FLAO|nr:glycosyltransferase family A protein [Flavobacterium xanthum]SHL54194.1 Glycosyl transferase family 2 [Flavobacterium xanthum]
MLAIVIPYYKLSFFEETLQSLANQTDKRFKVYIGDDASLKNPSNLIEKYRGQFDFVYHRFESNLGGISLVKQWERCIAMIGEEEWIMILGDDDYLDSTVVNSWHKHYDAFYNKSNVVRFASKAVDMRLNGFISDSFTHPLWENATDSYYRRFKGQTRSSLSEYVFSKESFLKYGFRDFPLAWHSDDAAWLDFSNDKLIYTICESNIFVRHSDECISGSKENQDLKSIASENFCTQCIYTKLPLFVREQRKDLLMYYETSIKNNRKLKFNEWYKLMYFYTLNFQFIQLLKCFRRFIKSFYI